MDIGKCAQDVQDDGWRTNIHCPGPTEVRANEIEGEPDIPYRQTDRLTDRKGEE